jgi:5-methyltetrahydrofolate--homocysteine methyltransferase
MSETLQAISEAVITADAAKVTEKVQQALDEGLSPDEILNGGLIAAMQIVGDRFEQGDFFVPEMLVSARTMKAGLQILKPHMVDADVKAAGVVVLGTVQGDLHDIGKNLVGIMIEGAGFEVIDLGTDVSPDDFVKAVQEHGAKIVGMSALLTTTMTQMQKTIMAFEESGLRDQVKILVGGAPVTKDFAAKIGADGFATDASRAVGLVKTFFE